MRSSTELPMRDRRIDLNSLLMLANVVVAALVAYVAIVGTENEYVNAQTAGLGLLLCLETQVALWLERRYRDPMVILLAVETILYYALRIFTLTIYPSSLVFERYAYDVADTNFALQFILVANVFLYAGLFLARRGQLVPVDTTGWRASSRLSVVLLIVAATAFSYYGSEYWSGGDIPRALNFLVLFLTPGIVELMAFTYYFLFRKTLTKSFALVLAVLIGAEMIVHTLVGSRSAIVTLGQNVLIVLLAIHCC